MTVTFPGCPTATEPLGIGTWAWGDQTTWGMGGYDADYDERTITEAWDASLAAGVTLIDTAEIYGGGESERIIGRRLAADPSVRSRLVLATKFLPAPHKLNVKSALRSALVGSIERLGVERVDLYQIHGPVSLRSKAALADALAAVVQEGLTVGGGRVELLGQGGRVDPRRPGEERRAPGLEPDRVLAPAAGARDRRAAGDPRAARRGDPRLLADRAGPPHRQVLGGQPAAGPADALGPPDGAGRPDRGRAAAHR